MTNQNAKLNSPANWVVRAIVAYFLFLVINKTIGILVNAVTPSITLYISLTLHFICIVGLIKRYKIGYYLTLFLLLFNSFLAIYTTLKIHSLFSSDFDAFAFFTQVEIIEAMIQLVIFYIFLFAKKTRKEFFPEDNT